MRRVLWYDFRLFKLQETYIVSTNRKTGHTGDSRVKGASGGRRSDFTCTCTQYLNREQATSVDCEQAVAGGKEGQRQTDRKES